SEGYDRASREERRRRAVAALPPWYNPGLHLALPALFGLGIIALASRYVSGLSAGDLAFSGVIYLLSNAVEWRVHRDLLHRRMPFAEVLYDRHTPQHHAIYLTEDMAMRERREWALVLLPAYAILLILLGNSPIAFVLYLVAPP